MTWIDEFDWLVDPWQEIERMRREMNRLFRGYASEGPEFPAISIVADEDKAQLIADIPGVDPEKLDVEVSESALTISGERPEPQIGEKASYVFRERGYGRFRRNILLPFEVDSSKVESIYRNGVLSITLPRAAKSKPRKVEIKTA